MQKLVFIYPPNCYHIHHYIALLLALMLFIGHKVKNTKILYAIIFLFVGLSLEDLMYGDFLKIKDDCHNIKLIKLLKKKKVIKLLKVIQFNYLFSCKHFHQ